MNLELSKTELEFLKAQVDRRLAELEDELVHSDSRDIQRGLAHDVDQLRAISQRLAKLGRGDSASAKM